jgi:hypothetical protein
VEILERKVIRILDLRTILLDIGALNGAEIGDRYKIFSEGEDIIDPLTQKNLGRYEFIKAIVTLTRVFENFSEAQLVQETLSPAEEEFLKKTEVLIHPPAEKSLSGEISANVRRAKEIMEYPWFAKKEWQREIKHMLHLGVKLELEALSAKDFSFITETYLPTKIKKQQWLD